MSWRIIYIESESSLFLLNNNLVVQKEETKTLISLEDINTIIIENQKSKFTLQLINTLVEKEITVIFCNQHHLVQTIIQSANGHHRRSKKIKEQISWDPKTTSYLWTQIITHKILNQKLLLQCLEKEENIINKLEEYKSNVTLNDQTNREGLAAKIYFRELYGKEFIRFEDKAVNFALNYGYAVIAANFTRVVIAKGYITELGINHSSEYNNLNFVSDIMEPFRPFVDYVVEKYCQNIFDSDARFILANVLNLSIKYNQKKMFLTNAIEEYVQNMIDFITTGDTEKLIFPILENIVDYEL